MKSILSQAALLERQSLRESNARTYPRAMPLAIARAKGVHIWDVDGRQYLDFFAGAGALALGHNHPRVQEAVRRQLDLVVHALDFPTPTRDAFITELLSVVPESLRQRARVHICAPTGSDAVEAAIKLCKCATGRTSMLSFTGGYHGMTAGALSVTSLRSVKERVDGLMPAVQFAPYAHCHSCSLGLTRERCDIACAALCESLLGDPLSGVPRPAAAIMEMVQGEGGSVVPERAFVERVREATRAARVPLIADEVQAGMGRTGKWFAFEHFGIEPDVIVVSKALGGAGLPIAAIVYDSSLDVWAPGVHIGTFRGHQLAMAAGIAGMRVMREQEVLQNARARGEQLLAGLQQISSPVVSNPRGLGLMVGVDFRDPDTGKADPDAAAAVRRACFDRGLICELGGRDDATLRLIPPLIVTREQVDQALQIICESIRAVHSAFDSALSEKVA